MITVTPINKANPMTFEVHIDDGRGQSRHEVTVATEDFERLTGGECTPAACVEAAFRFLLDREPKEAILKRFDLTVIPRYFPEFERELPRYIAQGPGSPQPGAEE